MNNPTPEKRRRSRQVIDDGSSGEEYVPEEPGPKISKTKKSPKSPKKK